MKSCHVGVQIGDILRGCLRPYPTVPIIFGSIGVKKGTGTDYYKDMELLPECSRVHLDSLHLPQSVEIVTRGRGASNQGPFRFVWSNSDDINPDQSACLGMSIVELVLP